MSGCQAHIECIGTKEKHFCKPLRCRSSFTCSSTLELSSFACCSHTKQPLVCGRMQLCRGWDRRCRAVRAAAPRAGFSASALWNPCLGGILSSLLLCLKSVEMDNCVIHTSVPTLRDFWSGYAVSQSTSWSVVEKWSKELAAALWLLGNLLCRGLVIPARCCRCGGAVLGLVLEDFTVSHWCQNALLVLLCSGLLWCVQSLSCLKKKILRHKSCKCMSKIGDFEGQHK